MLMTIGRRATGLCCVAALLCLTVSVIAQGSWSASTPLPKARDGRPATACVNGKIYVIGGNNNTNVNASNLIFDTVSHEWSTGSPLPAARRNAAVAVVNGRIHVLGGAEPVGNAHADHFVYDPAANTWSRLAPLPFATTQACAVAIGESIYFMGGGGNSGGRTGYSGRVTAYCYRYDETTNTWSRIAPMLTARALFCAVAVGNSIMAIGGHGDGARQINTTEMYDVSTNTWSVKPPMPSAKRDSMVAEYLNGLVYVIGGSTISNPGFTSPALAINEVFDPAANTWRVGPAMPTARYESGSAVVNNTLFVVGGRSRDESLAVVEVFSP